MTHKGNPRCEKCEGRGIVRVPRGYAPCTCVKGKPNHAVIARLAAVRLPDFITYCDEYDKLRSQGVEPNEASDIAYARSREATPNPKPDQRTDSQSGDDVPRADPVPTNGQLMLDGMPGT